MYFIGLMPVNEEKSVTYCFEPTPPLPCKWLRAKPTDFTHPGQNGSSVPSWTALPVGRVYCTWGGLQGAARRGGREKRRTSWRWAGWSRTGRSHDQILPPPQVPDTLFTSHTHQNNLPAVFAMNFTGIVLYIRAFYLVFLVKGTHLVPQLKPQSRLEFV
jgi:hypothetical protein